MGHVEEVKKNFSCMAERLSCFLLSERGEKEWEDVLKKEVEYLMHVCLTTSIRILFADWDIY